MDKLTARIEELSDEADSIDAETRKAQREADDFFDDKGLGE